MMEDNETLGFESTFDRWMKTTDATVYVNTPADKAAMQDAMTVEEYPDDEDDTPAVEEDDDPEAQAGEEADDDFLDHDEQD